jgi:hypothetical protein
MYIYHHHEGKAVYDSMFKISNEIGDRRGHYRMVVGFTTICATSAYHH